MLRLYSPIRLLEASKTGREWDIVAIKAGFSLNWGAGAPRYYGAELLKRNVHLFEGRPVRSYRRPDGGYDHLEDLDLALAKGEYVGNTVAITHNARWCESEQGIVCRMRVLDGEEHTRDLLKTTWDVGGQLGFSVDALGNGTLRVREGRRAFDVTELGGIASLDLVSQPAAGGKLLRLVASTGQPTMNKLLALILAARPSWLNGATDVSRLTESQSKDRLAVTVQAARERARARMRESKPGSQRFTEAAVESSQLEEVLALIEAGDIEGARAMLEQALAEANSGEGDPPPADPAPAPVPLQESETIKALNSERIKRMLAESTLPELAHHRVLESFQGATTIVGEAAVAERIANETKLIASLTPTNPGGTPTPGTPPRITGGLEETDKHKSAFYGMLMGEKQDGVAPFRSLHESLHVISGVKGMPEDFARAAIQGIAVATPRESAGGWRPDPEAARREHHQRMRESVKHFGHSIRLRESLTTGHWPEVFGDSMHRMLLHYYNVSVGDWRPLAKVVPIKDFRDNPRVAYGGYGDAPIVGEGAVYPEVATPEDHESKYRVQKRGRVWKLTMESLVNDDLGAIRDQPIAHIRAMGRTLHKFVMNTLLFDNPTMYDGKALIHADHGNHQTATLSLGALQTALLQFGDQTEEGSGEKIGDIQPRYLIIPNALRFTAHELLFSEKKPDGSENKTVENVVKGLYGMDYIINHHASSTANWIISADPYDMNGLEVGFLGGREEPEVFTADAENLGAMLTSDTILHKFRQIYGGVIPDWRGYGGSRVP